MLKNNILALVLATLSLSVFAESKYTVYEMTDLELTMLPPFCTPWARRNEAQTDLWVKKLQIPNIHHLCKGLNHVNHAIITNYKPDLDFQSKTGIGEFSYIIEYAAHHGSANFPLKAFILENRAKLFMMSGEKEKAIADYKQSISINPKYTKSFASLVDLYIKIGDKGNATFFLNEGLKYNPQSKSLLKIKIR